MVRRYGRRLLLAAAAAAVLGAGGVGPASAAPKGPKPTAMTIAGGGIDGTLTISAAEKPQLFTDLLQEVSFLAAPAGGQISAPKPATLGDKFTVVVLYDDKPRYTYDLYPLAQGGPKAFRPAAQPDKKKTTAGWFLGRMTMSEALRLAGAPLPEKPDVISGGIGGGERVIPEDSFADGRDLDLLLAELRRLVLLNGGVVLALAIVIGGVALIIRRRTR